MNRKYEKTLAGVSLAAAVAFAFTALIIRDDHDVTASIALVIAQFLTLTATLLGLDYKFHENHPTAAGNPQQ